MQLPTDLDERLSHAAKKLNLTKSGVARMALDRGLAVITEQLAVQNDR